eukprot:CAMPEP_0116843130 /NCGR_PEP_ID=MMETSP0418-20121206/11913_1 /TAXON_ID=1158023 /ORGANISM="Astrosyne radiata, Strain 13vi08-1A" /LENGTH=252 /DNA_ID=CAMNT_0004473841 /DNA_START=164 /DNA_END=922 /DNA_ORIENTATION=-
MKALFSFLFVAALCLGYVGEAFEFSPLSRRVTRRVGRKTVTTTTTLSKAATEWVEQSLEFYSRARGEGFFRRQQQHDPSFLFSSMQNYLRESKKTEKNGESSMYRRLLESMSEEGNDPDAHLAIPTLLLGLLLQRQERFDDVRKVFDGFLHLLPDDDGVDTRGCSARVLQAYALMEIKQGNPLKAFELVSMAIGMDKGLSPILNWVPFQDALSVRQELLQRTNKLDEQVFRMNLLKGYKPVVTPNAALLWRR